MTANSRLADDASSTLSHTRDPRDYTHCLSESTWPFANTVVLDGDGDDVAVWVMDTSTAVSLPNSRFQANWNVHVAMVPNLPAWSNDHALLATERGLDTLPHELREREFIVDAEDLTRTLTARIALLDAALQSSLAKEKRSRIPTRIAWPHLESLGLPALAPSDGQSPRSIAFHNALWLARFCAIWDTVEHERASVPCLRGIRFP